MSKIKFGIIGCGRIADRFAKALAKSPVAELYACAARDQAKADAFAAENGAEAAYGSYQALLDDPNVQAVYIATVHTTHAECAKMCIDAGKPVLCEKPFFVNEMEAKEVIAYAKEKKVLIMEGFWSRLVPAYHKAKEWIRDGKIGDIRTIHASFCFNVPYNDMTKNNRLWNPETAGGALLDAGVYPYQYVTGIMDGAPDDMNFMLQRGPSGVDATVAMTLKYNSGTIAECLTSISSSADTTAIISGSEGQIKQYYFVGSRKCELLDRKGEVIDSYEDPEEEGFVHEIAHFVQLMNDGKLESDLIPLEDNLDFMRKVDMILTSDAPKKTVTKFTPAELAAHEEKLRFDSFSAEDAMKLAQIFLDLQKEDGNNVGVRIVLNNFEVFRYMPAGTGSYNSAWMDKKLSTVQLMGKSTLRLWTEMDLRGVKRVPGLLPTSDIVFCGGGFPIMLKNGTVIGAIAVSGPAGDEYEHGIVVRALEKFLTE